MVLFGTTNYNQDLGIANNCNDNYNSFTNFPTSYDGPDGLKSATEESKCYLGGAFNFKINTVEAFQLVFIK